MAATSHRREIVAVAVGVVLVVAAFVVPHLNLGVVTPWINATPERFRDFAGTAPIFGWWNVHVGWGTVPAIVIGAAVSAALAPPALVLASTVAFALSELADFAVYTPLQRRGLVLAVLASSAVGLVADSVLFLWLAFHSLDFLAGQVIGKALMVLLTIPAIHWLRRRDARLKLA